MLIPQTRLVPTLRARWPNAEPREMGPNRQRSWQNWQLARLPRLHEARYLGTSLTKQIHYLFTWIETRYPPSCCHWQCVCYIHLLPTSDSFEYTLLCFGNLFYWCDMMNRNVQRLEQRGPRLRTTRFP